ncbi:hypothetical protein FHG89_29490, partial [Micromonospora orduensis]
LTGDRDDVAAELQGERFRHDRHPSSEEQILTGQESTEPGAVPWTRQVTWESEDDALARVVAQAVCADARPRDRSYGAKGRGRSQRESGSQRRNGPAPVRPPALVQVRDGSDE